ncbi:hypothetical protein PHYPSEUDO_001675 [Phytophthora pseudosyringae]|uniref:Uncharacterized protein n=1 Tax=Phytophthora pseudosyringae TaxID=221518 RepID=A0A8T1VYF7_9STRA|nr:hypothetical protein PHYPSEUDO_001675 [Phytophthora pseudosyringae]
MLALGPIKPLLCNARGRSVSSLTVNEDSCGLDVWDDLAAAVINADPHVSDALSGPIFILPCPSRQCSGTSPSNHPMFSSKQQKRSCSPASKLQSKKRKSTPVPTAVEGATTY